MIKTKKKYLWFWAVVGVVAPVLLYILSHTLVLDWNALSSVQKMLINVAYPAIYIESLLSFFVMDLGLDSGLTGHFAAAIVFSGCWLLNAGIYVLIGLILWHAGAPLLTRFERNSMN